MGFASMGRSTMAYVMAVGDLNNDGKNDLFLRRHRFRLHAHGRISCPGPRRKSQLR